MQTNLALGCGINTIPVSEIGGAPPLPDPILDANYASDSYLLNGVAKTLVEIIPDLGNVVLVAGSGLAEIAPATTSASATLYFSNEVFAALPADHAISGVIDVTVSSDQATAYFDIDLNGSSMGCLAGFLQGGLVREFDQISGAHVDAGSGLGAGSYHIGYTFTPTRLALCLNGGPIFEITPVSVDFPTLNDCYLYLFAVANETTLQSRTRIWTPLTDEQLQLACA